MRWDRLFADLETQFEAAEATALAAEIADRTRAEAARIDLRQRLRAAVGCAMSVVASGGDRHDGRLAAVGRDWLLLTDTGRGDVLVPLASTCTVWIDGRWPAGSTEEAVSARLGLPYVLRRLARDRAEVTVAFPDGRLLRGNIDRVGADHFAFRTLDPEGRRPSSSIETLLVATSAVSWIRAC